MTQHREWNPKTFFKKVSPEVTALFEDRFEVDLRRDETLPFADRTYFAWKALPEAQREKLETMLLPVNDLCSGHARPYLDQLAREVWLEAHSYLIDECVDWSVYDLAMRLFIDAPEALIKMHQGYAVDMMDHFKEYRGKHPVALKASDFAKTQMREAMIKHFRSQAGGAQCQVEDFEGEDKFAIFIYHENEMKPVDRFDDTGIVVPEWMRPVTRIAAVFYYDTNTLLVKAPRKPEREKLRDLFATIFVREKDYFEDLDKTPKFNFAPLTREGFVFASNPSDGIEEVCITRVSMRSGDFDVKRVTVELKRGLNLFGVRRALEAHGLAFDGEMIDGVHLQFVFSYGTGRARFRTVSLHNPNNTNLRDTPRDRVIRRYLKEWGIDENRNRFALAASAR